MKEDKRKLITFDRILGEYSVSGAIHSYGDVIDFVDGEKQGIVLIDTCGHCEESGREMSAFVKKEIENGWGVEGDAEQNLCALGEKLAAMREPGLSCFQSDEWFDYVSASYTQFNDKKISLAMGGGLAESLIFRKNGTLERILSQGDVIDGKYKNERLSLGYLINRDSAYTTILNKDEILFLCSDGIHNMAKALHFDSEDGKIDLDTRNTVWYAYLLLTNALNKNFYQSAGVIRDSLISELSQYFLPRTSRDDDVTFAVVKRNK